MYCSPFFCYCDCTDHIALFLYFCTFVSPLFRWLWWRREGAVNQRRGGYRHPLQLDGGWGATSSPWREGTRVASRGQEILLFPLLFWFAINFPHDLVCVDCYWPFPPSLFKGVRLLQSASLKREESRRLETEAQQLETEGWGKLREAIMGSEAEGFYGLLRGVTLHSCPLPSQPPPSCTRLSPSSPVFQQTPQESTGPEVSGPEGPATVSTSVATSSASEGNLPADMVTPLYSAGGCQKSVWMLGWGLQRGPIHLTSSCLCPCEESPSRCGVGVPPLQQIFLQPRHL